MNYRFSIQDRFNNITVIDEPVGWDGFVQKVKRHPERHGTMREIQNTEFEFTGIAAELINDEHDEYGANGDMSFIIDWSCGSTYSNLYTGKFMFKTRRKICKDYCSVMISIEQTGALVNFIYRLTTAIDLDATKCLDGVTDLAPYSTLKQSILLKSKAIVLKAKASLKNDVAYDIDADSGWFVGLPAGTGKMQGTLTIPLDNNELSEIETFQPDIMADFLNWTAMHEVVNPILDLQTIGDLKCFGVDYTIHFKLKGRIKELNAGSGLISLAILLRKGPSTSGGFVGDPSNSDLFSDLILDNHAFPVTQEFDYDETITATLNPGDKIWFNLYLTYEKFTNFVPQLSIEFDKDNCLFEAEALSFCEDTNADGFLLHEALSRITESISNNQLKVYSEYYGRTDSLPYSFPANGCGGMRAINNGLLIRQNKLADGSDPKLFISMDDMIKGLFPIDNVGMGNEFIGNQEVIRIENWKYFYKNNVTLFCKGINSLERYTLESELYSGVKNGYEKWEAEEYNGLDEFATKREWIVDINGVQNTLEKISKFIASGYAIEVTRRKANSSKDWRYDNNIFIICLVKNDGEYEVEQGNIISPANIVHPPTVINFRLSPARNLMRWYDRIMASIRNLPVNNTIRFSKGEGNYLAAGKLSTVCIQETGILSESQNISLSTFENEADALPINFAERVKFSFPVSNAEYEAMDLNGLIYFESSCDKGYGWIDEFYFKPDRESDFLLIPKR